MRSDALRPGDSLPPVRALAERLDVNRNTVAAAYQRLVQAGIALTQGRLGTILCGPPHAGSLPKPYLYGEDTILPALRQLGEDWLRPDCLDHWALELTHGAVDAIERLAVAYLVPGDKVAVEDPCFLGIINALRLAGMQAVGVAMDGSGMLPDALAAALDKGARAVLLTPPRS